MLERRLTPAMRALADLLESRTGQILSDGRRWRLETSLQPVLKAHGLTGLDSLVAAIADDRGGALAQAAVEALLNQETCFFRDAPVFDMVAHQLFPALIARQWEKEEAQAAAGERTLHIWCAGCSTGQEAYSLAMLFRTYQERWPDWRLRILASDISTGAIARARSGLFAQNEVQRGLPVNELLRWFDPQGDQWRIHESLRDMIDFRVADLFDDSMPASSHAAIFCRDVLPHVSGERKSRLLGTLAHRLDGGGYLVLGAGETLIGQHGEFLASQRFRGAYERVVPLS